MKKIMKFFLLIGVIIPINSALIQASETLVSSQKIYKNIILMIPDGTSLSLVSTARWYQFAQDNTKVSLAIDPHICGLVKTYSSNSPIGDSAPTTSCYMTGIPSQTGFVSTYPPISPNDIVSLDSTRAYQPLTTLMEAASLVHKMKLGLVFTCEFPHATPADCIAHTPNRKDYNGISKQMISKNIDIVFGGGVSLLSPIEKYNMENNGYTVLLNNYQEFKKLASFKSWSLFSKMDMPYEIDRNDTTPSLSEMTDKALRLLNQENTNGFFLMVEGSKIDWAAHDNDAKYMLTEFLAFDQAVKTVLDFAKKDQNTLVVIMPDHGNSGISMGNVNSNKGYDETPLKTFFSHLDTISMSAYEQGKRMNKPVHEISAQINKNGKIGFTTTGHTGEDVFLAVYSPKFPLPQGLQTNVSIHQYMATSLGLQGKLDSLTQANFCPHTEVFKDYKFSIDTINRSHAKLRVLHKQNILEAQANHNYILLNGEKIEVASGIVYVKENGKFYLPFSLRKLMKHSLKN